MTSSIKPQICRNYYTAQKTLTLLRNCERHSQNTCMSSAMVILATRWSPTSFVKSEYHPRERTRVQPRSEAEACACALPQVGVCKTAAVLWLESHLSSRFLHAEKRWESLCGAAPRCCAVRHWSWHYPSTQGRSLHGGAIFDGHICSSLEISWAQPQDFESFVSQRHVECITGTKTYFALLHLALTRFSEVSLLTSSRIPSFMSFSSRNNFCRWLISWLRCSTLWFRPSISFSYTSFWDWKWLSNTLLKKGIDHGGCSMTLMQWVRLNTKGKQSTVANTETLRYTTCALRRLKVRHGISEEARFPDWHIHTYSLPS